MKSTAKSVAEKAHVKPGTTFAVLNPEPGIIESLGLPKSVRFVEPAAANVICMFIRSRAELDAELADVVRSMADGAALWVFFRKGSKAAGFDVNRDSVWYAAEALGMRPISLLSVDEEWSVFRLRRA